MSSINSRTKIYNTRDFHAYITNIEEDITNLYNNNYNISLKYDKKIDNIINRYEHRTNKLFMDLRHRERQHNKFSNKLDCIIEDIKRVDGYYNKPPTHIALMISDIKDIDKIYTYILHSLYAFTLFVITLIITSYIE